MIKLFTSGTTRGLPPVIVLEEANVPHELVVVDIRRKERPAELFEFNPQGRMPAVKDETVSIDQSVAILIYLADKLGVFLPRREPARSEALRWLMFSATDIMTGHGAVFRLMRRTDADYSALLSDYRQRLIGDVARFDEKLVGSEYLAGDISIADLMMYAIVGQYERATLERLGFVSLLDWIDRVRARPSVQAAEARCPYAYDVAATLGDEAYDAEAAIERFRPVS